MTFPAYTIAIADQLSSQLARFVTLNPHQLAGHVANLDFWSDEVTHGLGVIDQYKARFDRLAAAQSAHVLDRHTIEFELDDEWGETAKLPPRPRRMPDHDRLTARSTLCDTFYRFLVRCHSEGLIDETTVRKECERHGISIDPHDLKPRGR